MFLRNLFSLRLETSNPQRSTKPKKSQEYLAQELSLEELFFCLWFPPIIYFVFGSGSSFWLLGPPKAKKPRGKRQKNVKKHKKNQRISRNVWAKDFVQRHFFLFSSSFLFFGSGSFCWQLGLPKTKKNVKRKKTTNSQECLGQ